MMQSHYSLMYGAITHDDGVQFTVYSKSATGMRVLLYDAVDDREPARVIDFNPFVNRLGDIWTISVPGLKHGTLYHFQADGPFEPDRGQRFSSRARLIDPFAHALAGTFQPSDDGIVRPPKCVVIDDNFDWNGDRHLCRPLSESVIYELHVRGFTQSPTSQVKHPGTYLGLIEKIPYLKRLGVTAVELMPVQDFMERHWDGRSTGRTNYWGYDPLAFFAPHRGYASSTEPGAQVHEFKQMVQALHAEGIEVILDVVFNHTAESDVRGPTLGFRGLENQVYYLLENGGRDYANYSGCGNSINGNHPIVREMIFHCLRHWAIEYHIDGFRFDLASILSRDRRGHIVPNPPIVEAIAEDPFLANMKLIAEAWDAGGAYQVGSFAEVRWAEWNGRFRDDVRRYWNGFDLSLGNFATRLAGSSDLYQRGSREPYHGINFVTSHDGYTLNDLVSYARKHNEANGENNRDGDNQNFSINFGVEGETDNPSINARRQTQLKNLLATLMLSQGVPMLLAGDEIRHTQQGNNNAYCQNNELSWFDWSKLEDNLDLFRFTRELIAFRRSQPALRRDRFLTGRPDFDGGYPDICWFNAHGLPVDWLRDRGSLMCVLGRTHASARECAGRAVLMMFHAAETRTTFELPLEARSSRWRIVLDTAAPSPDDIYPQLDGPLFEGFSILMPGPSVRCFVECSVQAR